LEKRIGKENFPEIKSEKKDYVAREHPITCIPVAILIESPIIDVPLVVVRVPVHVHHEDRTNLYSKPSLPLPT